MMLKDALLTGSSDKVTVVGRPHVTQPIIAGIFEHQIPLFIPPYR